MRFITKRVADRRKSKSGEETEIVALSVPTDKSTAVFEDLNLDFFSRLSDGAPA